MTTPAKATAQRARREAAAWRIVKPGVEQFLSGVLEDAVGALNSPVLLAAGSEPFTQNEVMARWEAEIETLENSGNPDLVVVAEQMRDSELPLAVHAQVAEVLLTATAASLTVTALRSELTDVLLPAGGRALATTFVNKVKMTTRTAVTSSYNFEALNILVEGEETEKVWVAHFDERTRPTHREATGQRVGIHEDFMVGGYAMAHPSDMNAPPQESYNCRCVIASPHETETPVSQPDPENYFGDEGPTHGGNMSTELRAAGTDNDVQSVTWAGVIGVEGELTGDGRYIEHDALRWDLPAPFRYVSSDVGAHDGAVVAGRILTVERQEGGLLWATGDFDMGSVNGVEAARQVGEELTVGVSMDLDDVSFEVRVAADLLAEMDEGSVEETPVEDDEGRVTVAKISPSDEVMYMTDGRVRAATLVAIPAFASAQVALTNAEVSEEDEDMELSIVASASKRDTPPANWFTNPNLDGPTALVVTEDGQVYGHLAVWDTCHISHSANGQCVTPPYSSSDYAHFHLNPVTTDDGEMISAGKLTVSTKHAGGKLNSAQTTAHYEDTGSTAAFVRAGEDAYGIWVAGSVSPDATAKQVRSLRTSPLSGDWRNMGGGLELVAALSVNVPGFPIPRPSGLVASGELMSLVASGMVPPKKVAAPGSEDALSADDLAYLRSLAQRERSTQHKKAADLLAKKVGHTPSPQVKRDKVHALAARMKARMQEEGF